MVTTSHLNPLPYHSTETTRIAVFIFVLAVLSERGLPPTFSFSPHHCSQQERFHGDDKLTSSDTGNRKTKEDDKEVKVETRQKTKTPSLFGERQENCLSSGQSGLRWAFCDY